MKKFSKDFQNFNSIGFWVLFLRCANFGVAVCRAANSGCSEPNPVQRDLDSCRFSPLPDRNGRKLVDDWGGTTRGSFPTDYAPAECGSRQTHPPKMKPCRERPMCRSASGERYIPVGSADLSPLISRLRDSFPPKGKPFYKSPFVLHSKVLTGANMPALIRRLRRHLPPRRGRLPLVLQAI